MFYISLFMNFRRILSFIILISATATFPGCKTQYAIESTRSQKYVFTDSTGNDIDSSVYQFIKPYRDKMEGEMNTVIGVSEQAMERGMPEGRLGNFVADACMIEARKVFYPSDGRQPDFTILNNGGLRRPLPSGNITVGNIYELMPFENE